MNYPKKEFVTKWRKSRARKWISENIECYFYQKRYRDRLGKSETGMLRRIGIAPLEIKTVPVESLYMQYRTEWHSQCLSLAPVKIVESPLVNFLKEYIEQREKIFLPENFQDTAFCNLWKNIDQVGFRYDWYDYPNTFKKNYPDSKILRMGEKLVSIYESINQTGYLNGMFADRMISVLTQPFENSRFGKGHPMDGYEVWSGHHRAASLAVLGEKTVRVVILKDKKGIQEG
jgi:hypothetical protein